MSPSWPAFCRSSPDPGTDGPGRLTDSTTVPTDKLIALFISACPCFSNADDCPYSLCSQSDRLLAYRRASHRAFLLALCAPTRWAIRAAHRRHGPRAFDARRYTANLGGTGVGGP